MSSPENTEKKKSARSRLLPVANVLTAQISMALLTAGSFVVTPAMLAGLGDAQYGGWLLINSVVSFMRYLDLGTSAGTMKYAAGALERGDTQDLAKLMNSTAAIFATIGTVVIIGTGVLSFVLPRVYPTIAGDASSAIFFLGAALAVDFFSRTFAAALRAKSLFFINDGIEIITYAVFKLGLLLYYAYHGGLSYKLLGSLTFAETIVRNVIVIGIAFVLSPWVRRVNPFKPAREMIKKLAVMNVAMSLIHVADLLRFQVDASVLGYFMPEDPIAISIFGVGTRLASIAYTAIGVIGAVLIPRFSGLSETGDQKGVRDLLARSSLATGLSAVLVLVNLFVIGPHFLELWLKKPWIPTSGMILRIMLPAYYVMLLAGPSAGMLIGRGQLRGLTTLTLSEGVANLVMSCALVKPFGIYGVAIGTVVPMVVFRGIFFPMLLKKEIDLPVGDYFKMNARPALIGLVYLALIGGFAFVPLVSYGRFLLIAGANVVIYVLLLLVAVPEVRAAALTKLRRRKAT